jgi:hypothetical protein
VAGRTRYELVLTPAPTERTLLREVRVAVDAEKRMPLRLTGAATGSTEPALQVGFTELTFGPQDPALFTFTPPPGATVTDAPARDPATQRPDSTTVGDGWVYRQDHAEARGHDAGDDGRPQHPDLSTIGAPVSGTWGSGRLITTAVGSAIVTDDGRIAAGAVPAQVLTTRSPGDVRRRHGFGLRPSPPGSAGCARYSARPSRWRMSTSTSPTAPCSACSAPTAQARPPSSGCCSA